MPPSNARIVNDSHRLNTLALEFNPPSLMLLRFCLLIVLFFAGINLQAQQSCECPDAESTNKDFRRNYEQGRYDSAAMYAANKTGPSHSICEIVHLNRTTLLAIAEKRYSTADSLLLLEAQLLKGVNCPKLSVNHLTNRTLYYNFLNLHDSAVKVAIQSLEIAEAAQLLPEQIKICANLGALFNQMGQNEKSIAYNQKGLEVARRAEDEASLAMILNQLANNYLLKSYMTEDSLANDSAFGYASEGLTFAKESGNIFYTLESFCNLSMSRGLSHDHLGSMDFADSILVIVPKTGNPFNRYISLAYVYKSDALFELEKYEESRSMADSALKYAELFNMQIAFDPLDLIYQNSKKLNDYEKALWAYERISHLRDSFFTLEKNAVIAELDGKYNQEKNERSIEQLNAQNQFYLLLGVIGLLLIIVGVFFWRQQSLREKHLTLQTEQRLNRARINPHFFFNVLSSLQTYSLDKENAPKLPLVLSKYARLMRQTLESSYNELVTIEEENELITNYLALQQTRFPGKFEFEIDDSAIEAPSEVKLPSMIIQPFAENSIEHGFANMNEGGMLKISYAQDNKSLVIIVSDNGTGSSSESSHPGYPSRAMQIIADRLKLLDREMRSKSSCEVGPVSGGRGYMVTIRLPLIVN